MEKWDVYDSNGMVTGRTKTRNDIFKGGEYHLGVCVWIINNAGSLLIQRRAASKRIYPNMWASTGGSVLAGETSKEGCIRETKEEIGIDIDSEKLVLAQRKIIRNRIFDDYIITMDFPIENAVIQPEEVSEIKWASMDEIKHLWHSEQFLLDDINDINFVFDYIGR